MKRWPKLVEPQITRTAIEANPAQLEIITRLAKASHGLRSTQPNRTEHFLDEKAQFIDVKGFQQERGADVYRDGGAVQVVKPLSLAFPA